MIDALPLFSRRHVLERARRRPDAHLELEFVYGFAGNTKFLIEKGQRCSLNSGDMECDALTP